MGAAAGPVGGVMSIASVGLSAMSTLDKAEGQKAANDFQAAELDRAAEYGDLKAVQTGASMTQKLNMTLGNIDVIRAAAHTDPTSPTGAAVRDYSEDLGTNQKNIAVDNILAQSQKQRADAAYLRVAGQNALLAGQIGAGGQILGGIGGALGNKNFGFGSIGGGSKFGIDYGQAPDDI